MEQIKRRRLDADAWRAMLERFARSGLTVQAFCQQEAVSVASFYRWRSALVQTPLQPARAPEASRPAVDFVELGTLGTRAAHSPSQIALPRFELRLDLGGGLQLHLVRG